MTTSTPTPRHITFTRVEWAKLRENTPLTLSVDDLAVMRGLHDRLSMSDVEDVYLPLSRLLNLHVLATRQLHQTTDTFLGTKPTGAPYVIGIAGSVAVGKSTTARVLQALLHRNADNPTVDLVTTDGFLWPNAVLESRGLMRRKGFPESYDLRRLLRFLADVKAGRPEVSAPVYSHQIYDVLPDTTTVVRRPDILIVEGLNVLQGGAGGRMFVSDYFDFSIYVDASTVDLESWYVARFMTLCETVFTDPHSYFHRYSHLTRDEAEATARGIWRDINAVNLAENIVPTRDRAHLVLTKGPDHGVRSIRMRKR